MSIVTVVIGSKNYVKTECIADALDLVLSKLKELNKVEQDLEYHLDCIEAPSGVAEQPRDYKTALKGVRNRISFCKQQHPGKDIYIAIESGIHFDPLLKKYFDFSYVCLQDANDIEKISKSAEFEIEEKIMMYIDQGKNLSEASGLVFNVENVGQTMGISGIVSYNHIPRKALHLQPTIFVLTSFFKTKEHFA